MSYVISISNVKGGVAKTTTCLALGSALAQKGHRVLLVDLDQQADLTLGVGNAMLKVDYGSRDLFLPAILDKLGFSRFVLQTAYPNLHLVPSNGDLLAAEQKQADWGMQHALLKKALTSGLAVSYDFILLDCPPAANAYTLSALSISNLVMIPTQAESFSANSLLNMMTILRTAREYGNPNLDYRVVITLLDLRSRFQREMLDEFRKGFQGKLFTTCILIDTKIRESQSVRVPIIHYKPDARGAVLYQALAHEVLDLAQGIPPEKNAPPIHVTPPLPQATQSRRCPFLGYRDDLGVVRDFPSEANHCHRATPIASPALEHQANVCLGNGYASCPMLATRAKMRLPDALSAHPPNLWSRLGLG